MGCCVNTVFGWRGRCDYIGADGGEAVLILYLFVSGGRGNGQNNGGSF